LHSADRPAAGRTTRTSLPTGAVGRARGGTVLNCAQPGCTGQIVDGYCDVCGMAPVRERAGASAPPLPETPGGASPASSASQPRLAPSTATSTYRAGRRSGSTRTRGIGSSRLGAGLVEVPPVPARNPADAILTDPSVPENRR